MYSTPFTFLAPQVSQVQYLMDLYPGAFVSYSLRLTKASFFGLNPIRVRRNTTPAIECDVRFDTNNLISLNSAISNFSGGSSAATNLGQFVAATGYSNPDGLGTAATATVTTFRDQMGTTNHLIQTTASLQPRIVTAGVLETNNGHVSMFFDSAIGHRFTCIPSPTFNSNNNTIFSVGRPTTNVAGLSLFGFSNQGSASIYHSIVSNAATQAVVASNTSAVQVTQTGAFANEYSYYMRTRSDAFFQISVTNTTAGSVNATVATSGSSVPNYTANAIQMGTRRFNTQSNGWSGYITEGIIYNSDQSANRTAIQLDQITAF
jgi:hypothetical protein